MSQRYGLFLVCAALLFTVGCGGGGDSAAPSSSVTFNFTAISKVMEANPRVVAVAVDFGKDLPLNWDLRDAFEVTAELKAVKNYSGDLIANSAATKAPRTITKAYTSDKAEIGNPKQGRYVIIEMDQADPNAASWYFGFNPGTRQAIDYKDNMIYGIKLLYNLDYFAANVGSKPPATVDSVKTDSVFKMTATKILTADDFVQGTFTISANPTVKTIAYNFYAPKGLTAGQKVPVVLYLHGSGQSHDEANLTDLSADVKSPLLANQEGVTWIENAKEKCFVILPQLPSRVLDAAGNGGWQNSEIQKLVLGLLDKLMADNATTVDTNRVYLGGLSMGGSGSWKLLLDPATTSRFAAATIDAAGPRSTATLATDTQAQKDAKIIADVSAVDYSALTLPLWTFICDADGGLKMRVAFAKMAGPGQVTLNAADGTLTPVADILTTSANGLIRSYSSVNLAGAHNDLRYTEYQYGDGSHFLELGAVTQLAHNASWEILFKDKRMIDWLFSKSRALASGAYPFTAISKVMEANPRVVAVAIDFGKDLPLNWQLDDAFKVTAELKQVKNYSGVLIANSEAAKAPRTILKAYTSDKAEIGNPKQGRYVIIEMDQGDTNAASWYFGFNPGTRQAIDYKENMIYEVKLLRDLDYYAANVGSNPPSTVETVRSTDAVFTMTSRKILTADNFVQGTFTNNANPTIKTIAYNLYTPTGLTAGQKVPVVLYLHGSGQSHDAVNLTDLSADIKSPLLANQEGVTWIENAKEKCFVILPQLPSRASDAAGKSGWQNSEIQGLVMGLLDKVIADNSAAINTNRLYLGGLSMGGFGSWSIILDPVLTARFAAAVIDAGTPTIVSTASTDTPAQKVAKWVAGLSTFNYSTVKLPLWLFHCDTDPQVNILGARIPFTKLTGKATIDVNGNLVPDPGVLVSDNGLIRYYTSPNVTSGNEVRFTEYQFGDGSRFLDLGMVTQNGHFSWEPMFKTQAMIDWMFSKTK